MVRSYIYALGAVALWSGNFVIANAASTSLTPIELAFYRWLVALVLLLPVSWQAIYKLFTVMEKADVIRLATASIFGISAFNTLIYWAGRTAPSINLSLIAVSAPAFITVFNKIIFRAKVRSITWLGVLLATLGCALLIGNGSFYTLLHLNASSGDLIMLLAAITFAIYTVVQKRPDALSNSEYLFLNILLGEMFLIPLYVIGIGTSGPTHIDIHIISYVLYLGTFSSFVAFYLWNRSIHLIGSFKTGVVYYILPVFVYLINLIIYGSALNVLVVTSFGIILTGVLLIHITSGATPLFRKAK